MDESFDRAHGLGEASSHHAASSLRTGRTPTIDAFLLSFVVIFIAELGDKTMLATLTLATDNGWFGTWIGSTLGMVAADALAIGIGAYLGKKLPEKTIRIGAAVLFFVFGVWLIAEGLRG